MDNYLASSTAAFPQPNVESLRWSCCCRFFGWCGFVGAETLASPWTAFRAFPGGLVFTPRIITQTLKITSWSQSHQVHLAGEELFVELFDPFQVSVASMQTDQTQRQRQKLRKRRLDVGQHVVRLFHVACKGIAWSCNPTNLQIHTSRVGSIREACPSVKRTGTHMKIGYDRNWPCPITCAVTLTTNERETKCGSNTLLKRRISAAIT